MTAAATEMKSALTVLAMSKTMEGNKARADWLRAHGVRVPNLYGDVVVLIARTALVTSETA